jgi:hypothetical protein
LTANGSTAARPNSQPPSGRPGQLVADDAPSDHPGVGPVEVGRIDQPGHERDRGGVAQGRTNSRDERREIDKRQPGAMREDRHGQRGDDRGPCHVHDHHQAAPVAAVDQHAQPGADHQPGQALHGGDGRDGGGRARELRGQQGERSQPDTVAEVGQKPR